MALNDFLIGLQFRFGTDSKSTQAVSNIKKGLSDITQALDNMNKIDVMSGISKGVKSASERISEFSNVTKSFEASNYTPFSNITEGLDKNLEEAKKGVMGVKDQFNSLDETMTGGYGMWEFVQKLKKGDKTVVGLADRFRNHLSEEIRDVIGKMEDFNSTTSNVKETLDNTDLFTKFRGKTMADFFPGESFDRLDKLDQTLVKAKGFEMMKQSIESTDNALSSMIGNAVLTKEAAEEIGPQMQEAFSKMRIELDEANFEKVSNALAGINLEDLKPGQVIKVRKEMAQFNKLVQDGATSQALAAQAAQIQRMVERSNTLNQSWQNFTNTIRALVSGPLGTLTQAIGFYAILTDATRAQEEAVKDITRLNLENAQSTGEARNALRDYQSAMLDVGEAVDVSLVRAQEQMQALAQQRLSQSVDELARLAETSIQAQYALGISADAAAGLAKDIMLIGGASEEGFRDAANEIAVVQDQMGLTSQGATEVASTVGVIIRQMNALGGSADNVAVVTREVAKMTSAFEQAGMSAGDASQMLNNLMDPQKLSDNTLLFHSMGMSAQEALAMMSGEGQNMEGMTERMVGVARRLKDQYGGNIYALQSMAEAHGMSLAQVQQLSTLSADQLQTRQDEAALEEQAAEARASMNEQMAKFGAQLNILMQRVVLPLVGFFTRILEVINGMVTGTENFLNRLGGVGDAVKVVIGALLIGLLATKMTILKGLLPAVGRFISSLAAQGPLKMLSDGLKGVGSQVGTLANTVKDRLTGAFSSAAESGSERLRDSITNITPTNQQRPRAPLMDQRNTGTQLVDQRGTGATGAISAGAPDTESVGAVDKLGNSLEKIDAKKIMQIGAALFLVAGAVALLAFSYKMLVDTVKDSSPGELGNAFLILIGIMGALAGMAFVLGKVSQTAGPKIMVLGAALLMVAGAASLLIVSMTLLLETMKDVTLGAFIGGLIILVATIYMLTSAIGALGKVSAASSRPILAVGAGLLMMGAAVALVIGSMALLFNTLEGLSSGALLGGLVTLIVVMGGLRLSIGTLGKVSAASSRPILAVGAGLLMMGAAVALVIGSMALLFNTLEGLSSGAIIGGLVTLIVVMGGLIWTIGAIGAVSATTATPILAVGAGLLMMGAAAALIVSSMALLFTVLEGLSGATIINGLSVLSVTLGLLILAVAILGTVSAASAPGILAVGAGLLMMGAAAALVISSMALLFNVIENLSSNAIINGLAILGTTMSWLITAILALGLASAVAGPNVALLGLGLLMVGAATAMIVGSMALLLKTIEGLSSDTITSGLEILTTIMGQLIGTIFVLGIASRMAGPNVTLLGAGLLMVGAAVALIIGSMALLLNTIKGLSSDTITSGLAILTTIMGQLIGTIFVLGVASKIAGPAVITLGAGLLMMAGAVLITGLGIKMLAEGLSQLAETGGAIPFAVIAGGMFLMAMAARAGGKSFLFFGAAMLMIGAAVMLVGFGIKMIAEAIQTAAEGVSLLADSFAKLSENQDINFKKIAGGLAILGLAALVASPGLKILGENMYKFGVGLSLAAENLQPVIQGLAELISKLGSIPESDDLGLNEIGKQIFKFGLFALFASPGITALGNAFMNMGQGISDINDKTAGAVEQLKALKEFLTSDDLAGLSQNFNSEIDKINNNLSSLSGGGIAQAQARLEQNVVQQASVDNRQEAPDQEAVVDQLAEANTYLSNISNKIDDIARSMTSRSGGDRTRNDSTQVQVS